MRSTLLLAFLLMVAPWVVSGALTAGEVSAMRSLLHSYPSLANVNPWRTYTLQNQEEVNFGTPWVGDFSLVCASGAKYSYFGITCTPDGHIGGITVHPDWGLRNGTACLELEGLSWLTNVQDSRFQQLTQARIGSFGISSKSTMANTLERSFHRGIRISELLSGLLSLYEIKHLEVWAVPGQRLPYEEILSESSLVTLTIEVSGPNITAGYADSIFRALPNLRGLKIVADLAAITLTDALDLMPVLESLHIRSSSITSLGSNFSDMVPNLKQLTIGALNLVTLDGLFPSSLESLSLLNLVSLTSITGNWPVSLKQLTIESANRLHSAIPNLPLGLESFTMKDSTPSILAPIINSNLKKLTVFGYPLSGDADLPMDSLRNLEELTIDSVGIVAPTNIPLWLCRLPSTLRSLRMSRNYFDPTFPSCLFNASASVSFPNMVVLEARDAFISEISIANVLPASLRELDLSENRFPSFPDFSSLMHLSYLELSQSLNRWEEIPAWIGTLPLRKLCLNRILFSSPLPTNLFSMGTLEVLELELNQLQGTFPLDNPGAASLRVLSISRNNFSDISTMQYATSLKEIKLQSNQQRLTVPSSENFALALNLTIVDISDTQMVQMPMFWKNHANLEHFDASNSASPGVMPVRVSSPRLRFLHLRGNPILGSIPEFDTQMTMSTMILSNNDIEGTIPSSIQNVHILDHLEISFNNISGDLYQVPWSQHTVMYLEHLALTDNSLSGPIIDFSDWISLRHLEISTTRVSVCLAEPGGTLSLPPAITYCNFRSVSVCDCELNYNTTCSVDPCNPSKREEKDFSIDSFVSTSPFPSLYRSSKLLQNQQKAQPDLRDMMKHHSAKKKEGFSVQCVPAPIYVPPPQAPSTPSPSTIPVPSSAACIQPQPPGEFTCIDGVWHSNSSIVTPTFPVPSSVQVFINGNLTVTQPITFAGLDSVVHVNGCIFLQKPEVIVQLSKEQEEELKKQGKTTKTMMVSTNGNECSGATDLSTVIVTASIQKSCRRVKSDNIGTKSTLSVVFQMEEKQCKVNLIVPIVVGSVLGLILLGTLVIVLFWKPWYKKPTTFSAGAATPKAR